MLKALELFGFKSFADRTRFDFAAGITCVVGPNGSGKSNVVDSIKWLMGDQSPKSLRGKEMTDVIFNGSARRKPAGFAEATLTFDNSHRSLAIDAAEVRIGRRVYRSGEAEYIINNVPARLKDVKDLFLGTGAGTSAYSIIEQGRVDQLLQASNVNRRNVFEEAAGVSRFRQKKQEAERKLERVAQSLLRLTDIVTELETRLTALRSQAGKAAKYRELSQQLRQLRLGLAADDYRALQTRRLTVAVEQETLNEQSAAQGAALQAAEIEQRAAEAAVTAIEDELRVAERSDSEVAATLAGHAASIRHLLARRQELEQDHTRLVEQQTEMQQRALRITDELQQAEGTLQQFIDELAQRRLVQSQREDELAEIQRTLTDDRNRLEEQRSALLAFVRESSVIGNRTAAMESQISSLEAERKRGVQRLDRLSETIAERERDLVARQLEADAATAEATVVRARADDHLQQRSALRSQLGETQQRISECREQRSALLARKLLLEDLERRQEGIGVGVRDILARARESHQAPWSSVLGHVVELLEVDIEHAALVEVALGSRSQLIVLNDDRPLREFLLSGNYEIAGRVGFLTLLKPNSSTSGNHGSLASAGQTFQQHPGDGALPIDADLPNLADFPGVLCRADRLVRAAADLPQLPAQLLADTWIVESLADASLLAARSGGRCRFVTLQGELLESNGSLFVGSVRSETAVVSRKSELRGVKTEIRRLDTCIAADESQIQILQQQIAELELQLGQMDSVLQSAVERVADARAQAQASEFELQRVGREQHDLAEELARGELTLDELRQSLEQHITGRFNIEKSSAELQQQISVVEISLQEREQAAFELRKVLATEQRDLARFEEQLEGLQSARTRLDAERFQRELHRDEAESRFRVLSNKTAQINADVATIEHEQQRLTVQREALLAEVHRLQTVRDASRLNRSRIAEEELRQRRSSREIKDRLHTLEMQSREIGHLLATLTERLHEEYQVDIVELAESEISARAEYLALQATEHSGTNSSTNTHETDDSTTAAAFENAAVTGGVPTSAASTSAASTGAASTGASSTGQLLGNDPVREHLEQELLKLRRKIKALGQVSNESLTELDELETRYSRLHAQLQDLVEARNSIEEIIKRLSNESRRLFSDTFNQIRTHFRELFRKLFGGGDGDIVLEDPDDILECGIDIVARPPGKELRSISLLSGGEKTMTAVALLLAIFKSRPSPFCILDEVDAALDEGNVERYLGVLREFQQMTQFIVITHSKRTMSGADVLYGVTMEEAGISKRMSVRFEDVNSDGSIKTSANSSTNAA